MNIDLKLGDCLKAMREMDDNSVDSVVSDPPYGISFMGKKWDYDVPKVGIWQEAMRVLKPGGHILVACGTRTQHRMAVNIEDAGFEIRDIVAWVYGSGFPKSLNIGKAVDKRNGTTTEQSRDFAEYIKRQRIDNKITLSEADQVVCGGTTNYSWFEGRLSGQRLPRKNDYLKMKEFLKLDSRYDSFMEEAEREVVGKGSAGFLEKNDVFELDNKEYGNFDLTKGTSKYEGWGTALKPAMELWTLARKPLSEKTIAENVLKWGTGGINIDGCRVEASKNDRQDYGRNNDIPYMSESNSLGKFNKNTAYKRPSQGRFPANLIHDGSDEVVELFPDDNSRFFYCAKASKSERNAGLEGFEEKKQDLSRKEGNVGGDNPRNRGVNKRANHHPTVKPIKLMQYLVRLITPKDGTVLDPYMGSGTTGIACKKENFNFVGIELDKEYFKIAEARIKAHQPDEIQHDFF